MPDAHEHQRTVVGVALGTSRVGRVVGAGRAVGRAGPRAGPGEPGELVDEVDLGGGEVGVRDGVLEADDGAQHPGRRPAPEVLGEPWPGRGHVERRAEGRGEDGRLGATVEGRGPVREEPRAGVVGQVGEVAHGGPPSWSGLA